MELPAREKKNVPAVNDNILFLLQNRINFMRYELTKMYLYLTFLGGKYFKSVWHARIEKQSIKRYEIYLFGSFYKMAK